MRFFAAIIAGLVIVAVTLACSAIYDLAANGPLQTPVTVMFGRGEGFAALAGKLEAAGVVRNKYLFEAEAVVLGAARKFKAGEYQFQPQVSAGAVLDMIASGKVVVHKFTVPEGLTVREILAQLNAQQDLTGAVDGDVKEGELLPETYHYIYGDKRQDLVQRMQADMNKFLAAAWEKRKPGLPFKTPYEALTLASIVEKETGVDTERGRVAAVFINRLRIGMKLQTDPTVQYAIERDKGPMNRALLSGDLAYNSPYNTYVVEGLPPGPICNPGRAAIEAVLNPPDTKELYFVATGTGGHNFAETVEQHNANVAKYRAARSKN